MEPPFASHLPPFHGTPVPDALFPPTATEAHVPLYRKERRVFFKVTDLPDHLEYIFTMADGQRIAVDRANLVNAVWRTMVRKPYVRQADRIWHEPIDLGPRRKQSHTEKSHKDKKY